MPHFKSAFPSKFLNAAEIEKPYDAVIAAIELENVGTEDNPERKLVATFQDGHKAIVLNQTRCEAVTEIAKTPDYEKWPGVRVQVSQGVTRFNGKRVPCIELGPPAAAATSRKGKPGKSAKPAAGAENDVPF